MKWSLWLLTDLECQVFSRISCGKKPSSRQRIGELTMQWYCYCLPSLTVAKNGVYFCSITGVVHGNLDIGNFVFNLEVYTYVCTYVHVCVCACVFVHVLACVCVCVCVCVSHVGYVHQCLHKREPCSFSTFFSISVVMNVTARDARVTSRTNFQ